MQKQETHPGTPGEPGVLRGALLLLLLVVGGSVMWIVLRLSTGF